MSSTLPLETLLPLHLPSELSPCEDSSLRLDHIGVAVRSLSAAQVFYQALGLQVGPPEVIEVEHVRVAMVQLGATRLELIESLDTKSVISRFLERRGEGLHHIALWSDDIGAKFDHCKAAGLRLVSDSIRVGAGGHSYFFVHPSSAAGVLIEVVGRELPLIEGTEVRELAR